jgi:hypothetical protein
MKLGDLRHQAGHHFFIQTIAAAGQQGGAQLNHDSPVRQARFSVFFAALTHIFSNYNLLHYSNHPPVEQGKETKNLLKQIVIARSPD